MRLKIKSLAINFAIALALRGIIYFYLIFGNAADKQFFKEIQQALKNSNKSKT